MIRRCIGRCGRHNTCQPYRDARTVEYLCENCRSETAKATVIHSKSKMVMKVRATRTILRKHV